MADINDLKEAVQLLEDHPDITELGYSSDKGNVVAKRSPLREPMKIAEKFIEKILEEIDK